MRNLLKTAVLVICVAALAYPVAAKVSVTRDKYGIPTIKADTELELYEAFGYVTAQDRLWQMELNRRAGRGTLAEIFGPKLVPADIKNRLTGYTEAEYQAIFKKFPKRTRRLFLAYLKGVNRRVAEVVKNRRLMPLEYMALKIKPAPFTVPDVLAFVTLLTRFFGVLGGEEVYNLVYLQKLVKRFGKSRGWKMFNDWQWINDPSAPTYTRKKMTGNFVPGRLKFSSRPDYLRGLARTAASTRGYLRLAKTARATASAVGAEYKLGSYAWALLPKMTGTGFPILVGQPQMGHSVPSIIFEVALKGGAFDVVGMSFPLIPGILIGHNRHLAWTHMVGMIDSIDVYQEQLNPKNREQYKFKGAWRTMAKRVETIKVARGKPVKVVIYRTIHGPVVAPFPFDPKKSRANRVFSLKMTHWRLEPLSCEGWLRAMLARDYKQFGAAMSLIRTSLHTIYADIKGNIGYWQTGLNAERPTGFDPRLPLPGTGRAEWTGRYLPNAHEMNPAKGYVAGWNNKASPDARNPFDAFRKGYFHFGPFYRSIWVDRALAGRKGLNLAANHKVIRWLGGCGMYQLNGHHSYGGAIKQLLPIMARAVAKAPPGEKPLLKKILAVLSAWDGRSVNDVVKDKQLQAGMTIFSDWLPRAIKATFADEFTGLTSFKDVRARMFGLFLRCLAGRKAALPVSIDYFDNVKTPGRETAVDVFLATLRQSAAALKARFKNDDPATWRAPRPKIVFKHKMFGPVAEMYDNNIGTYVFITELRPTGAVGYSRWPMGQSGHISLGPNKKPLPAPHFLDMLPLYKGYRYQKMGMD
jgi:penicillin amidase